MVILDNRMKQKIRKDPLTPENLMDAFIEIQKLIKYYETEIKLNINEAKHASREGKTEQQQLHLGKVEAYTDNVFEMKYIFEIIRGHHRDLEDK